MNNKASVAIYAMMVGLTLIILALALAPAGNQMISQTMNASTSDLIGLDCDNSSISSFDKAACVATDFSQAYFFGGLILIAGGIIVARIIF